MGYDRQKVETLAETLKATGLAASATQAIKMAEDIVGTEKKVSTDFTKHADEIAKRYDNERPRNNAPEPVVTDKISDDRPLSEVMAEPPKGAAFIRDPAVERKPKITVSVEENTPEPIEEEPQEEVGQEIVEPVETKEEGPKEEAVQADEQVESIQEVEKSVEPVQDEPQEEVVQEVEETEKIEEVSPQENIVLNEEPEFIISEEPEQRKFKHPIEKVDLSSHFNFSNT